MAELTSELVAIRLARLAELYVPETIEQGRARLEAERLDAERPAESFADGARRRLAELRALDELTRALHRARPKPSA